MSAAEPLTADRPIVSTPMPARPREPEPRAPAARLGQIEALDRAVEGLRRASEAVPERARPALAGDWLGHALHPLLTDLAIGFWTSAWTLDLVGGRRSARAATLLVGLGVASALPTAASGLVDWREMDRPKQRVGVVHALANVTATALYAGSFVQRCRGRRGRGILTGMAAAGVATVGGYLGGHLAFGESSG
ncbi:MAG: DUF2231 domain-containing protein [Acidimicrobiales bacterium]